MQICKLYFAKTESTIQMIEMIENISLTLDKGSFNSMNCLQKALTPQQPLAARSGRLRQILRSTLRAHGSQSQNYLSTFETSTRLPLEYFELYFQASVVVMSV